MDRVKNSLLSLACSFSLADLCLSWQWGELNRYSVSTMNNYQLAGPYPETIPAILCNLIIFTLIFCVFFKNINSPSRRIRSISSFSLWFFLGLGAFNFRNVLRGLGGYQWLSFNYFFSKGGLILICLLLIIGVAFLVKYWRQLEFRHLLNHALMIYFPVSLFHLAWLGHQAVTYDYGDLVAQKLPHSSIKTDKKILWLIFDTLEERHTFGKFSKLHPNLLELRNQSFYATNAYSPGTNTLYSMSSLITGKKTQLLTAHTESDLLVDHASQNTPNLLSHPANLFAQVQAMGHKIGVVGWAHPYCRTYGKYLEDCVFFDNETDPKAALPKGWINTQWYFIKKLIPFTTKSKNSKIATYEAMLETTIRMLKDPNLSMVFVHWNIPHGPWIYNPKSDELEIIDKEPSSIQGHLMNVALSDKTMGILKSTMEKLNTWDETLVLLSSDHFWWHPIVSRDITGLKKRLTLPHQIPFLAKLPHQKSSYRFDEPFNTILTKEIFHEFNTGNLTSPQQLEALISKYPSSDVRPVLESVVAQRL